MDALSRHAFDLSVAMAREDARQAALAAKVTRYAIKVGTMFVGPNRHWTMEAAQALTFGSMTMANAHAILDADLGLTDYSVEAV
jgi:hypothetical protein